MIDIIGDVIHYDRRPVAIIIVPNGTLRSGFEDELLYDASEDVAQAREETNRIDREFDELKAERDSAIEKVQQALRYAEDDPKPDWQKLIEILS